MTYRSKLYNEFKKIQYEGKLTAKTNIELETMIINNRCKILLKNKLVNAFRTYKINKKIKQENDLKEKMGMMILNAYKKYKYEYIIKNGCNNNKQLINKDKEIFELKNKIKDLEYKNNEYKKQIYRLEKNKCITPSTTDSDHSDNNDTSPIKKYSYKEIPKLSRHKLKQLVNQYQNEKFKRLF
jgi:hypothetical protein